MSIVVSAVAATALASGVLIASAATITASTTAHLGALKLRASANTSATITNTQNRDNTEIQNRITALNALLARVNAMVKVSTSTKAGLATEVQTEITNLNSLKAQIDADTSTTSLKTDSQSITGDYRIYMLVIPQGAITALADRVETIVGMMNTLGTKFQARISADQSADDNVTSVQATYSDYTAKVSDAETQAEAAVSETASLTPDQGNATVAASNTAALKDARSKLKTASADLATARKDAETMVSDLKALGGGSATTTAAVSASTTSQ